MDSIGMHRPRNVDWKRAAGLLYGDWGTSKAYVIGLAFVAAGYSSLPIILAVSLLTALVGYNYTVVCKYFPDGGGVYSAARDQSRLLAVMGALLLVANFTVTAALSGWAAMSYFGVPREYIRFSTMGVILIIGLINYLGPKHGGSLAVFMALPMIAVVMLIIGWSFPYLTTEYLETSKKDFMANWQAFVGVILALSGVEAIANLTGVMNLDPGYSAANPRVAYTARKSIWPVAVEVVIGTSLLGWAMLSVSHHLAPEMERRWEDMVRFLGEHYATLALGPAFGHYFGILVGILVGLLLISAVNTAISALIGLTYILARDGEMPAEFRKLNPHGVPWLPWILSTLMPVAVLALTTGMEALAGLYAIGVVGAITVNLGSCAFNRNLKLYWFERILMAITFVVLFLVELTIAKTKHDALFFACCILGIGLALRAYSQKRAGFQTLTVSKQVAEAIAPKSFAQMRLNIEMGQSILVAARGITPVLRFALEEARFRQATLYVLYVREIAVKLPSSLHLSEPPKWQNNPEAAAIMYGMLELGRQNQVTVMPVYVIAENPAHTIMDVAATLGVDMLILGGTHRQSLVRLLKGNVVVQVARGLPENIQLVIHG